MKYRIFRIITACLVFFLLDLAKPFGYGLAVEFSFLGVIFFAMNSPLTIALVVAMLTGYVIDCTSIFNAPLHVIEFPFLVLLSQYVLHHFRRKSIKISVFSALLLIHILARLPYMNFAVLFVATYVVQSVLAYLFIKHILIQWITPFSAEPTSPAF